MEHQMEAVNPPKRTKAPLSAAEMFEIYTSSKAAQKDNDTEKLFENAKCIKGNKVEQACRSEKCQNPALVCAGKKCGCRALHQKFVCSFVELDGILEGIDNKKVCSEVLIEKVQKRFDGLIDEISNQRDKIIEELRCVALQTVQKQFVQMTKYEKFDNINGNMVNFVTQMLHKSKVLNKKDCEQYLYEVVSTKLQTILKTAQQEFSTLSEKLSSLNLEELSNKIHKISYGDRTIQSQIITAANQLKNLIEFFHSNRIPLQPQSFRLLFRASENNFQVKRFWEKCHGIFNTVVLVKTSKDKIIGGFTPLSWKKKDKSVQQADQSGQSFLFSITENSKLQLTETFKDSAISHDVGWGPCFGIHDLSLIDNSISCFRSYAFTGFSYSSLEFEQNRSSFRQRVTGYLCSNRFKAIEWEVHEVKF